MKCECGKEYLFPVYPVRCTCGLVTHGDGSQMRFVTKKPTWVDAVSAWRSPDDVGVGDTFHRLAIAIGADRIARLIAWFSIDCGCEGRRQLWNEMYPYDNSQA